MRLLLWDIDGTLLRAGPAAREVFASAVAHAVGDHPGEHGVVMSGKTDPQIAREILATMRIVDAAVDDHLPVILSRLEADLATAAAHMREHGHVLPGVPEILAHLDARPDVVQTVLTGNIAANAAVKLGAFELDRWFDLSLGAYGSDHHDRLALVPIALDRARRSGHDPEEVWVIGDTPNDLACARAGGARCVLVATGRMPLAELASLGADAALADLSDVQAVLDLLLG
jgi:phosphoglycolate phosphatase